jgi:hypothetical protein
MGGWVQFTGRVRGVVGVGVAVGGKVAVGFNVGVEVFTRGVLVGAGDGLAELAGPVGSRAAKNNAITTIFIILDMVPS